MSEQHLSIFGLGVYDLHITVDEKQLYDVMLFSHCENIHLAFAVGNKGKHCMQLMTSQHVNATATEVYAKAVETVKKMQQRGIVVKRVKIEALANADAMKLAIKEFMRTEEYLKNVKYAFEFHYKVAIDSFQQQEILEALCANHSVSYAVNALSKSNPKYPLISQRVRGDYERALVQREMFRKILNESGVTCLSDGTHYEAIIYDSNYGLDEGFVPDPVEL